jgi:hypothetical protein
MPLVIGAVMFRIESYGALRPGVVNPVEKEQLNAAAGPGKDTEVHTSGKYRGAEG